MNRQEKLDIISGLSDEEVLDFLTGVLRKELTEAQPPLVTSFDIPTPSDILHVEAGLVKLFSPNGGYVVIGSTSLGTDAEANDEIQAQLGGWLDLSYGHE